MFLGVLDTGFLNISNYLPHLELRNHSIQIVIITNFFVISNVGIKRFDCISVLCETVKKKKKKKKKYWNKLNFRGFH